jgi:hypothetical protein
MASRKQFVKPHQARPVNLGEAWRARLTTSGCGLYVEDALVVVEANDEARANVDA